MVFFSLLWSRLIGNVVSTNWKAVSENSQQVLCGLLFFLWSRELGEFGFGEFTDGLREFAPGIVWFAVFFVVSGN